MKIYRIVKQGEQENVFEGYDVPPDLKEFLLIKIESLKKIDKLSLLLLNWKGKIFAARYHKGSREQTIEWLKGEILEAINSAKEDSDIQFQCTWEFSDYLLRLYTGIRIDSSTGWLLSESIVVRKSKDEFCVWLPKL
jgi:hypothetical protein